MLSSIFTVAGALCMGLGLPLFRRRVPPNAVYGLRMRATLDDDLVWYEANARLGRDLLVLGALLMVLAMVLPRIGFEGEFYPITWWAIAVVGVLVSTWEVRLQANQLLRVRQQGPRAR